MKITIYTVPDCKFSQAEKEYLKAKNLPFDEKNLESNRDFLTEMLQKSNNFAGTPVTEIVKDDGSSMIMKGFTQSEFDAALGTTSSVSTPAQAMEQPAMQMAASSMTAPDANQPMPATPTQTAEPAIPPVVEPPVADTPQPTSEAASAMSVPAADPIPNTPPTEPTNPTMPPTPEPMDNPSSIPPVAPQDTSEAQSGMTPPPATPSTDNLQPTMPDVSAGQVLSDNMSAPVNTSSMTPGAGQTYSTEPPAPTMPQAPAPQAAPTTDNPLNSVMNDLQSKANG